MLVVDNEHFLWSSKQKNLWLISRLLLLGKRLGATHNFLCGSFIIICCWPQKLKAVCGWSPTIRSEKRCDRLLYHPTSCGLVEDLVRPIIFCGEKLAFLTVWKTLWLIGLPCFVVDL